MDQDTRDQFKASVESATQFISADYSRLKKMEIHHNNLCTLIEVIATHDPMSKHIIVEVSPSHQVLGMDWRDILDKAMSDHMNKKTPITRGQ